MSEVQSGAVAVEPRQEAQPSSGLKVNTAPKAPGFASLVKALNLNVVRIGEHVKSSRKAVISRDGSVKLIGGQEGEKKEGASSGTWADEIKGLADRYGIKYDEGKFKKGDPKEVHKVLSGLKAVKGLMTENDRRTFNDFLVTVAAHGVMRFDRKADGVTIDEKKYDELAMSGEGMIDELGSAVGHKSVERLMRHGSFELAEVKNAMWKAYVEVAKANGFSEDRIHQFSFAVAKDYALRAKVVHELNEKAKSDELLRNLGVDGHTLLINGLSISKEEAPRTAVLASDLKDPKHLAALSAKFGYGLAAFFHDLVYDTVMRPVLGAVGASGTVESMKAAGREGLAQLGQQINAMANRTSTLGQLEQAIRAHSLLATGSGQVVQAATEEVAA